ncbi:hypothetical protein H2201_002216 [Coniosporium apollinis]|uniref:Uncharacterized protein n=2 Tax=Coniosporium TaxID=2810619 RepID=A0ABQ9NZ81_9PEZI|nr:hypothetical protein H2199_005648 [Cladosporium sp. JES 115]KAJ9667681.1 hypothetical protein H2201_002216 [Coniosporium apollinis]
MSDPSPNCAICYAPPDTCPCESERLAIAVEQAERRRMDEQLKHIREWVIEHSRIHILHAFTRLTSARKAAHTAYLSSLPHYAIYMQYSGRPPLHPQAMAQLQAQIAEAHAELKRGIDADWRASVLRYPEVLDYFYGLVELKVPSDRSAEVVNPPFARAGYADQGYDQRSPKEGKKKKKGRDETPVPERPRRERRDSNHFPRHNAPPVVPTPPIHPGYGPHGHGGGYAGYGYP